MKRISYLFFLIFIASLFASSCSNTKTYSQLLDDEKSLIDGFIKRNNIVVVSGTPDKNTVWQNSEGRDVYLLTPTGLYFHMINPGNLTSNDTIEFKNTVVPRYKQYTLGIPSDTTSNWSTIDYPFPTVFVYGDLTQASKAFQEAASYMKRNESEAKLIVPSSLGFSADMMSVTPYGYDLKIQIQK